MGNKEQKWAMVDPSLYAQSRNCPVKIGVATAKSWTVKDRGIWGGAGKQGKWGEQQAGPPSVLEVQQISWGFQIWKGLQIRPCVLKCRGSHPAGRCTLSRIE